MTILIQHAHKQYVKKDCARGFCVAKEAATKFKSIFLAFKYLAKQGEENIKEYDFIDNHDEKPKHLEKVKNNGTKQNNTNGRRRRPV